MNLPNCVAAGLTRDASIVAMYCLRRMPKRYEAKSIGERTDYLPRQLQWHKLRQTSRGRA